MQIHLDHLENRPLTPSMPLEGMMTKVTTVSGRKMTLLGPVSGDEPSGLMDPVADNSLEIQQQRVAMLSQAVQQQEAAAVKTISQFIPDFEGSVSLTRFLTSMRRMRATGNFQGFEEEIEKCFSESTMKHAAAAAVLGLLDQEGQGRRQDGSGSGTSQQNMAFRQVVENYLQALEAANGKQIRAGYNISKVAEKFSDGGRKVMPIMRRFYWKVLCEFNNPFDCYMFIMESFPESPKLTDEEQDPFSKKGGSGKRGGGYSGSGDEGENEEGIEGKKPPLEGVAGLQRLQKAQHFLSEAIGAELSPTSARPPSLEPAKLKLLLDGIFQIGFLVNSYKDSDELLRKFNHLYSKSVCICPHKLLSETLQQLKSEYVNYSVLIKLMEDLNIPAGVSRISFFTQFYGIISRMPIKVYQSEEHWARVDRAMREALDEVISQEDPPHTE